MEKMAKNMNCQIFRDGVEEKSRWAEYFKQNPNEEDVREVNVNVVGDRRMPIRQILD